MMCSTGRDCLKAGDLDRRSGGFCRDTASSTTLPALPIVGRGGWRRGAFPFDKAREGLVCSHGLGDVQTRGCNLWLRSAPVFRGFPQVPQVTQVIVVAHRQRAPASPVSPDARKRVSNPWTRGTRGKCLFSGAQPSHRFTEPVAGGEPVADDRHRLKAT